MFTKTTTKLLFIQLVFIAGLIVLVGFWYFLNSHQSELFLQLMHQHNEKLIDLVLASRQDDILRPLNDNSTWNETVRYIESPDRKFEQDCFDPLLETFAFNAIFVYNTSGNLRYAVNDSSDRSLGYLMAGIDVRMILSGQKPFCHFFLTANTKLFEVFGATIVPTNDVKHTTRPKGYLFFIKHWDPDMIARMGTLCRTKVSLLLGEHHFLPSSKSDADYIIKEIRDNNGEALGRLVFISNDPIISKWKLATRLATFEAAFLGIVIILVLGFAFRRWISRPLQMSIAEMKYSENRFDQVAEHADEWIWEVDTEGLFVYSNRVVEKILGYKPEELIGAMHYYELFPADKQDAIRGEILGWVEQRKELLNFIQPMIHKDGSDVILQSSCSPFYDNKGKWLGYRGTFLNITDQQQAMKELQSALMKAEENDKLKTAFLNNISHEIRTPMHAIIGYASILEENSGNTAKNSESIKIIQSACDHLLSIIDDIISIATLESGQEVARLSKFSLNMTLKNLNDQFRLKANEKHLSLLLNLALPDDQSYILSDEIKLVQVVSNLLNNAFKFTKQGYIEFGYIEKSGQLEFYVRDSGIGIPEEFHSSIFERFRQADIAGIRDYGGTGLGLSISKAYVELLGGNIWLESKPGEGSAFYFTLPFTKSEPPESVKIVQAPAEVPVAAAETPSILVAEDEDLNFMLIKEMLSVFKCNTIRASNGYEAVELFLKNASSVRLILMDIKMPELDGCDATRRIKKIRKDIPVIVQSAYIHEEAQERAFAAGADAFMTKPFNREELAGLLKKYLLQT